MAFSDWLIKGLHNVYRQDQAGLESTTFHSSPSSEASSVSLRRGTVSIHERASDGTGVFVIQSANAIPTRDNKLDTSDLLRSFVDLEDSRNQRPQMDLMHSHIRWGRVVDSVVIGYSLFDIVQTDDTPLGRWVDEQLRENTDFWEFSIEFYGDAPEPEFINGEVHGVWDGTGERTWIALLPKGTASHHNTKIVRTDEGVDMANTLKEFTNSLRERGMDEEEIEGLESAVLGYANDVARNPNARAEDTDMSESQTQTEADVEVEVNAEVEVEVTETDTETDSAEVEEETTEVEVDLTDLDLSFVTDEALDAAVATAVETLETRIAAIESASADALATAQERIAQLEAQVANHAPIVNGIRSKLSTAQRSKLAQVETSQVVDTPVQPKRATPKFGARDVMGSISARSGA